MSSTTVCIADTSVIPFPTLDSTYTRSSNTATGPLPHVPCRNTRSNPSLSLSETSASNSSNAADHPLQTTFMRLDSESSSSSSSTPSDEIPPTIIPRSKRVPSQRSTVTGCRDFFDPVTPASTPVKIRSDVPSSTDPEGGKYTPLRDPSDDEDAVRPFLPLSQPPYCKVGKLRLEGSIGRHDSGSDSRAPTVGTANANHPLQTIRKKSGQPVKSSLKTSRRPELHVVTDGPFAKSEPVTPTHTKAVHFDSKLEHVKLFLAQQKPLAVSRDGSPTSDTSGDEFPSFIYAQAPREDRHVKMLLPNMPSAPRKEQNVVLQGLVLSEEQRTITGTVRVRNIAFEKWLAIRFTLDWWQTTSEVTARYETSVEDGTFDVFTFAIRLHDIWARIEEKTIFIALRYAVAGQEHWDNNAGNNYHIKFVLASPSEPGSAVDNEASLRDLDSRLEGLAKARSVPIPVTPSRLGRSFSADHQYSSFAKSPARHDYTPSYKIQSGRNTSSPPTRHTRMHTYPSSDATSPDPVVPSWSHPLKVPDTEPVATPPRPRSPPPLPHLGSPREVIDTPPMQSVRSETTAVSLDSPSPSRERNHRRGYVDRTMEGSPTVRRTPPGSPLRYNFTSKGSFPQFPRTQSYPFIGPKLGSLESSPQQSIPKPPLSVQIASVGGGGSEEPTPDASQSSSTSASSCTPLLSPSFGHPRSDTSYKQFLDQFCFYTGADSLLHESSLLPRSQSASNMEHYLLSHSPPQSFSSHMRDFPARFPTTVRV